MYSCMYCVKRISICGSILEFDSMRSSIYIYKALQHAYPCVSIYISITANSTRHDPSSGSSSSISSSAVRMWSDSPPARECSNSPRDARGLDARAHHTQQKTLLYVAADTRTRTRAHSHTYKHVLFGTESRPFAPPFYARAHAHKRTHTRIQAISLLACSRASQTHSMPPSALHTP